MCTKNGSYCEKEKKVGGGHSRCKWRSEAFVKFKKKNLGGGQVGGGVAGVRVDVNGEVMLFRFFYFYFFFFFFFGGGGEVKFL